MVTLHKLSIQLVEFHMVEKHSNVHSPGVKSVKAAPCPFKYTGPPAQSFLMVSVPYKVILIKSAPNAGGNFENAKQSLSPTFP